MKFKAWRKKKDVTHHGIGGVTDIAAEADAFVRSVEAKAARNKRRSRLYVYISALTTTAIPAVVAIAETPLWLKLVTLILSLVLVSSTVALELDRPHERWRLYRKYQRMIEVERFNYHHKLADYNAVDDEVRVHRFAERLAHLQGELHKEWEALVPSRVEISNTTRNTGVSHGR